MKHFVLVALITIAGCQSEHTSGGTGGGQAPTAGAPNTTAGSSALAMCDESALNITAVSNGVYQDANCGVVVSVITVSSQVASDYTTALKTAVVQKGATQVITTQLMNATRITFTEPQGNHDAVFVQTDRASGYLVAAATWNNGLQDQQIYEQLFTFFEKLVAQRFPVKR